MMLDSTIVRVHQHSAGAQKGGARRSSIPRRIGRENIAGGVVENEVFEMDEFAVDPERSTGVGKVRAFDKARPPGERAMRSSRRDNAEAVWLLLRNFKRQNVIFPLESDSKNSPDFR